LSEDEDVSLFRWKGLGIYPLPGGKQIKEGKPAEALDHTSPTAADVVPSILSTGGLCMGQERGH